MKTLIHPNDKYQMNWIEGTAEWSDVKCPSGIKVDISSKKVDNDIIEKYTFTNTSSKDIFTSLKDIAIYTPFNDDYTNSETCIKTRCHTHIWCGDNITYIMALRMGGEAPHLGLVLTKGNIGGYSVERDLSKRSNDRGDFMLHPAPVSLAPNESFSIEWRLFWHLGKEDFYTQLKKLSPSFIQVNCKRYTIFDGEKINISIDTNFFFDEKDVSIMQNSTPIKFQIKNNQVVINETPKAIGEYSYIIKIKDTQTHCNVLVLPQIDTLVKARCKFIAEKQQYHNSTSALDGAYLIYDNQEKHMFYGKSNDYNGGRERVGMGLLIAKYLQKHKDTLLEQSLSKYIEYVQRELFDSETGMIFNDYQRDNSYKRLYNYPWFCLFYLELYDLYKKEEYLTYAYKILVSFYEQNGSHFYAIEIPLFRILNMLKASNMNAEYSTLFNYFKLHCDFIIEKDLIYPAHEVNFEQSIVAPATNLLLQMYMASNEQKYLDGAEIQIKTLELFNGLQPDYHMYEVAIRHWDGYWFGKRKLYGDTFPHYWSALTANAYYDYAKITNNDIYLAKADNAYRGVLSLFSADGTASCAYVYPVSVNGQPAGFCDPYANDQDWGLYLMLRYLG